MTATHVPIPERGLYRHFKGGNYELLEVARDSETEQLLVIYRALGDDPRIWVRPLEMFVEPVDAGDRRIRRFEPVPTRARALRTWRIRSGRAIRVLLGADPWAGNPARSTRRARALREARRSTLSI